jgi:hypothetical protein
MAKSSASLNIVASDFTRAMRQLAEITGVSFQDVIRAETKSILEAAVKKTQAAQVKLITARVNDRVARSLDGKTYLMSGSANAPKGWRLPDAVWAAIQLQIKKSIKRRKDARGLAKKSWVQAAGSLGIDIKAPAFVQKATTTTGDYPANANGAEKTEGNSFFIEITNSRTYTASTRDAIRAAMRGRTRYFQNNLKRGVFKKTSDIAAKYPGITATA